MKSETGSVISYSNLTGSCSHQVSLINLIIAT